MTSKKKGPPNRTRPLIVDALGAVGAMTASEMTGFLGLPARSIQYNLAGMVRDGVAHITAWRREPGYGGSYGPVYALGAGRNVPPPKPSPAQTHARKLAWQRRSRRKMAIVGKLQRRAVAGTLTPFSAMALQVAA